MNPILVWGLMALTFALMPLYVFPSGGLQAVDLPILALMLYTAFTLSHSERRMIGLLFICFFIFLSWAILVNTFYYTVFYRTCFFKPCIHLFYSMILFFTFIVLFLRLLSNVKTIPYIYAGILSAFILIPFAKSQSDFGFSTRQTLSFNDPNQLADFAILGIATVLVLHNYYKDYIISTRVKAFALIATIATIVLAHIYVLLSASRAGLGCMILLDLYIFWTINKKFFVLMAVILPLIFFSVKDTGFFRGHSTDNAAPKAISRLDSDFLSAIIKRVAGRIDFGETSLLYGIGKCSGSPGLREGYNSFTLEREAHNTLADIFYAYGLIGLLLFGVFAAIFLKKVCIVRYHIPILLSFMPINISQNFIRFRMLWIFYALVFSISILWQEKHNRLYK